MTSTKKISEQEKLKLRNEAKTELERLESFFKQDTDTVQLLEDFKNKFNICETVYKVILKKYQNCKSKKSEEHLILDMRQVPSALNFAGYTFDKALLTELFGSNSSKGETVKKLRDKITHGINKKAVKEISDRKDELFGYMNSFLSIIQSFDT